MNGECSMAIQRQTWGCVGFELRVASVCGVRRLGRVSI